MATKVVASVGRPHAVAGDYQRSGFGPAGIDQLADGFVHALDLPDLSGPG